MRSGSASVVDGLSLLKEGGDTFLLVFGAAERAEREALEQRRGLLSGGPAVVEDLLGDAQGDGGALDELLAHLDGFIHELRLGDALGGETDLNGLSGGDLVAEQGDVLGTAKTDETGQTHAAASAGQDAEAGLGQGEERVVGDDAEVAGDGNLTAAAKSVAVDGADDGLGAVLDHVVGLFAQVGQAVGGGLGGETVQVSAGNEGFFTGAGEDDGLDLREILSGQVSFQTSDTPPVKVLEKMAADGLKFETDFIRESWESGFGKVKNGKFQYCFDSDIDV